MIKDNRRLLPALYFNYYAHPLTVRLIPDLRDPLYLLIPHKPCNRFYQPCLVHLIRDLIYYDTLPVCPLICLYKRPCPHLNNAPAGPVSIPDAGKTMNKSCSGKVGALYNSCKLINSYIRVFYIHMQSVYNLTKIMWWYVCRHTNCNA